MWHALREAPGVTSGSSASLLRNLRPRFRRLDGALLVGDLLTPALAASGLHSAQLSTSLAEPAHVPAGFMLHVVPCGTERRTQLRHLTRPTFLQTEEVRCAVEYLLDQQVLAVRPDALWPLPMQC